MLTKEVVSRTKESATLNDHIQARNGEKVVLLFPVFSSFLLNHIPSAAVLLVNRRAKIAASNHHF